MTKDVVRGAKPLYQAVADALQEQIRRGALQPNERIPSESELCRRYSVGRNTVRHALSELVNKGVLQTVHGVGTFVVEPRLEKTTEYLYGLSQEMAHHGKVLTSQVLEARLISADPFLARRLQIQLGAEVVFLNRVRMMEGAPVAVERAYLPHELCPGILENDFSKQSLYEVLSNVYFKQPDHAEQEIEASLATPEVARLLGLTLPAVVLVFHRETRLENEQVIEYVDSELRADRFRFYTNLRSQAGQVNFVFQRTPLPAEHTPNLSIG